MIVKGAPELVLARCRARPADTAQPSSTRSSPPAAASSPSRRARRHGETAPRRDDEHDLELAGFLTFLDPPKPDAADALARLRDLEVEVKVITGDNDRVAAKVCARPRPPASGAR